MQRPEILCVSTGDLGRTGAEHRVAGCEMLLLEILSVGDGGANLLASVLAQNGTQAKEGSGDLFTSLL